jgi:nicotinamidase-related amidase
VMRTLSAAAVFASDIIDEWGTAKMPPKPEYLGSDLDPRLEAKNIKTVVICGTSAQGVVIGTGSGSAQRGYKAVVPVDCMSSQDPFNEEYAAWHMYKGGPAVVTSNTTLTRSTMVKFK